jgi:hypothetical protein
MKTSDETVVGKLILTCEKQPVGYDSRTTVTVTRHCTATSALSPFFGYFENAKPSLEFTEEPKGL